MPEAWSYLLRCCHGSLYTGWTVDLEESLLERVPQLAKLAPQTSAQRPT